jgi:hypothetical protein
VAGAPGEGWDAADQGALVAALTARGLYGGPALEAGWAEVGAGHAATPGVRVTDNPTTLRQWIREWYGTSDDVVTQGIATGLNNRLDAGETVAIWFDVANRSAYTAGGLQLTVSSLDPAVHFLDSSYNPGAISDAQAQILYAKVNGSGITAALSPGISTGPRYFLTNPFFARNPTTALWVKADPAARGRTVTFRVRIDITNGPTETVDFPVAVP